MKKTIKANINYSVILFSVLALIILGLFIHSILYYFHMLWTLFLGVSCLYLFVMIIISYQTVTLTKEGFTIKCAFFKIVKISWTQIAKIDQLEIESLYSHYGKVKLNWIVLYTDSDQKITDGGTNWKNPPWTIKATPENILAIKEFAPTEIVTF